MIPEHEREIDPLDQAADREAELREDALAEHRRAHPELPAKEWDKLGAKFCEACGEPIPDARRQIVVGVPRCIDCQTATERWGHA